MKFVYFGYDFMLSSVQRLIEDGHTLIGIFTFPCDNVFNFNKQTRELAQKLNIPISEKKPLARDIDQFIEQGCHIFLSAGYPNKIPVCDPAKAYSINFHPSYLPKGRGIMPTPYIITGQSDAAGATIHKLENTFDTGDILHQVAFEMSERESVETYSARIAMAGADMILHVFNNIEGLWAGAQSQNEQEASHFPPPDEKMRTLDWSWSVADIDKTARAFGRYGCLAVIQGQMYVIYDQDVWPESHDFQPGQIACQTSREITVTALDGYVCLKDFHIIGPT